MKKYKMGGYKDLMTLADIINLVDSNKYMPVHKEIVYFVEGNKILDLGCNIGNFSHALAKSNPNSCIIGVDDAEYAIEVAHDLYGDAPNLSFQAMSALDLKFKDNEFDCVCLLEVIEHLDDPISAIKEIRRVLKPGGKLILSTNNVYYSRFLIRQIVYDLLRKPPKLMMHINEKWGSHIFAWDVSTLCTLLKLKGFDHLSHFYVGSSGFYIGKTIFDKCLDSIFSRLFPFLRATVVVKLINLK